MPIEGGYKMAVKFKPHQVLLKSAMKSLQQWSEAQQQMCSALLVWLARNKSKITSMKFYEKKIILAVSLSAKKKTALQWMYTRSSAMEQNFRSFPQRAGKSEIQLRNDARCICELGKCICSRRTCTARLGKGSVHGG